VGIWGLQASTEKKQTRKTWRGKKRKKEREYGTLARKGWKSVGGKEITTGYHEKKGRGTQGRGRLGREQRRGGMIGK